MTGTLSVECRHLEDELMRVRFAHSQIVSDHPVTLGGTGTGPSPGELMMMALAAASVLAGRRHADAHGLKVASIGTRVSMATQLEGFAEPLQSGPLSRLTYIDRMWRLFEIDGRLSDEERDGLVAAMANTGIGDTLRNGIAIDERLDCLPSDGGRGKAGPKNPFHLTDEIRSRLPEGELRAAPTPPNWRVSATAIDDRSCLLKSSGSVYAAGRSVADLCGPTPEELLLGALASCTTVFVARNAALLEIPVDSVRVVVSAADAPGAAITRMEKVAEVRGVLDQEEIDKLSFTALYCALGETMQRGVLMSDHVEYRETAEAEAGGLLMTALNRDAPKPDDADFCNHGSCCVPADMQQASAQAG